jgi:2-oxo-3-hexenedioate decarboxylase
MRGGRSTSDTAGRLLDALAARRQIAPLTDDDPAFGLTEAYAVSEAAAVRRVAGGETIVGWKIGFTNRTIWDEYGVHAPIWGPVYDSTLVHVQGNVPVLDVTGFIEPRIEPEIVLRMARQPSPEMDERQLLACIDGVAHGFEIVQSLFPGWRFAAADTVAAFALHGALVVGPIVPVEAHAHDDWLERLARFEIVLSRDGVAIDRGSAGNVLGGPLSALLHFVRGLAERPLSRGIAPGDLITTGTVTRAFPIIEGETWSTTLKGIDLPAMTLRLGDRLDALVEHWLERAAIARFRFDNPGSSATGNDYADAVAANVEAEAEIARLLFRDQARLAEVRLEIARRAAQRSGAWAARANS